MTKIQIQALALLELVHTTEKKYTELNDKIRELQGDFPTHIKAFDDECLIRTVELIDEIIGDSLASYFMWECSQNGSITDQNLEFPIKSVDDIKKYMEWRDGN